MHSLCNFLSENGRSLGGYISVNPKSVVLEKYKNKQMNKTSSKSFCIALGAFWELLKTQIFVKAK